MFVISYPSLFLNPDVYIYIERDISICMRSYIYFHKASLCPPQSRGGGGGRREGGKPQKTIQSPRLYKAPKRLYKALKHNTKP